MRLRITLVLALSLAIAAGAQQTAPSPEKKPAYPTTLTTDQIKDLIRASADHDLENNRKVRDYTYTQRTETRTLDGSGNVKKTESETDEIMILYGEQLEKKIAKDDKPLSDKDARKEEEKIQKFIDKRKNESDNDRQKRLAEREKEREQGRQFVREVADAYNFTFAGVEPIDGHDTYVIDCDPRAGFQPHMKESKYLSKFRARLWIDAAESQLVKVDAQAIDTVSWGLFLARFHKGSRVVFEQTRVNDDVWLPKHLQANIDARLAVFASVRVAIDSIYSDYKKFRADTTIVPGSAQPVTEPPPPGTPQR